MYQIQYSADIYDDLSKIAADKRAWILDEIELQLTHEPEKTTKKRKILVGLVPPWEHVPPIWELESENIGHFMISMRLHSSFLSGRFDTNRLI